MGKILGIDLGTTNSCMAIMEGSDTNVIANAEGHRTTPSIVAFTKSGEELVGQTAKRQAVTNPKNTIFSAKRFMGVKFKDIKDELDLYPYEVVEAKNGDAHIKVNDKVYSPPEISAKILQKLKHDAEAYVGHEITEAVITVPAYFNDTQRQATKDAGRIAGLDVKRIINEPTAASLAYGLETKNDEKICVYDLGGGTFDVSILELGDGVFEVKATNGDTHLGGDDFDEVIIDWLIDNFKKENDIDLRKDAMALQRLKEAAEKAKCELSSAQSTEINLPFITADASGPKHLTMTLSRANFEALTTELVNRSIKPVENCIKDSKVGKNEINDIILVGGQTRMPKIAEAVKELFNKEASKNVNPDEVVALGAAIQGGVLSGDVDDIVLLDVTPLSLGIETAGGIFTKIIERNTTIPFRKSQVFSTYADNQPAVDIQVLQGERELAKDNKKIGNFHLDGIRPAPRGVPKIEVTFDIDANGILNVSAKDQDTGKEQSITIQASSGLSEEEINKMVDEAKVNAEQDKKARENIEKKNEAEALCHHVEQQLKEHKDKVDKKLADELTKDVADLKALIESNDYDAIKTKVDALQPKLQQLAQATAAAQPQQGASAADAAPEAQEQGKDDIIDADFDVVDEGDKKE